MAQDKENFSEFLITHLLDDFIPKWETWAELLLDPDSREFQLTLIRLFKGQIRAWRRLKLKIHEKVSQN